MSVEESGIVVIDTVYSALIVLSLRSHPENAETFAALLEEVPEDPSWTNSDVEWIRVCWEFETPAAAQELYERLTRTPVCGMVAELTASTAWAHGRPH